MASSTPRLSVDSLSPTSPSPFRNEYPFPRPGSSSRYIPRRGSTASSVNSIGGTLDTASSRHGLSEVSQNAISTLLQPPIVRTGLLPHTSAPASSAHKPPTARDIPPVTLTNIPTVDPSEFSPYLAQVGALYSALQRAREGGEEGGTQLLRRGSKTEDFRDILDAEQRSPNRTSALPMLGSFDSLASATGSPPLRRKANRESSRRAVHAPTPLSTIPSVYFDENFHLENPRTFDVVSERSEVVRPAPGTPDDRRASNGNSAGPRKALATNAILQEKLSWYMDTIEVHLIASISTASTSFFAALGSLRELHSEAADSVNRIRALRRELETLDQEMALCGLEVVNKKRRRENLQLLSNTVQQLKSIVEEIAKCEAFVDSGDVERALDAIDDLEKLIAGEVTTSNGTSGSYAHRDLRGANALQGITSDMDMLRFRIGKAYETKFLGALLGDLRRHVESVSAVEILQRWSNASNRTRGGHNRDPSAQPTYLSVGEGFRSELLTDLTGLHRARFTSSATATYRDNVLREVRNIVRRHLPASNDEDADSMMSASTLGGGRQRTPQEKSTTLARNLRALDPEDAESLLKQVYIGVGETLRRLGTQVKVLLDVTSTLGDPSGVSGLKSPPRSPNIAVIDRQLQQAGRGASGREVQEEIHQTLDMSNLLGQAVDIAQDKIVKVLKVRSEQNTHLSVAQFLRYFNLNLLFANECEAVSGRSGTALKTVVNGHIKEFVRQLSESEKQSLATGMEADTWNARDFTESDTEELTQILEASTRDPESWYSGSKVWLSSPPPRITALTSLLASQANGTSGASTPSATPSKATTRPAVIESESFILPVSAILCLHGISSFLHLNAGIPSMTAEIASSIVSYLALFNSRCTQLILGAGATRSAGLRNINTKHLALAAQALSFISSLIPHIREFVRRHAGAGTSVSLTMGEFDKVRRSYLEHQQSIYDKVIDMMTGRAIAAVRTMKTIDWSQPGNDGANTYMETLTKETSTLHRLLSKHLPEMTVSMIMELVFRSYKEQWSKAFGEVILESPKAQARMLRDAEYFKNKIGGIQGANDVGDFIVKLVKDKHVPKAPAVDLEPSHSPPEKTVPNLNGISSAPEPVSEASEVEKAQLVNEDEDRKDKPEA